MTPGGWQGNLYRAAQVLAGNGSCAGFNLIDRTGADNLAAADARARADVDDVIGGVHRLFIMLDDDQRITEVTKVLERR